VRQAARIQRKSGGEVVDRAAHRVAVHIAARAERGQAAAAVAVLGVEVPDQRREVAAVDEVKL
jgi:hypothetical protein